MPAFSSTQAGDWSNSATWGGAGVPGIGDTFTITHFVDVTDTRTVGTSPTAPSTVGTISLNGRLTIKNGGSLTCRGDVSLNSGGIRIEGGGSFFFDASASAAPTTTEYRVFWNTNNAGSRLDLVGTSDSSRAVIGSVKTGGAANGYIAGVTLNAMRFNAAWARFENLGTGTTREAIGTAGAVSTEMVMQDCVVETTVARINFSASATSDLYLNRVQFKTTSRVTLGADNAPSTGWRRTVENCSWPQGGEVVYSMRRGTVRNVVWPSNFSLGGTQMTADVWEKVFVARSVGNGSSMTMPDVVTEGQEFTDTYMLLTNTSATNPHYVALPGNAVSTVADARMRRWLFESLSNTSGAGDVILSHTLALRTWTVQECITVPNPVGEQPGSAVNHGLQLNKSSKIKARHNTFISTSTIGGAYVAETQVASNDILEEWRDNILWRPTPGVGSSVNRASGTNPIALGPGVGWNNLHNITTNGTFAENPFLGYTGSSAGALFTGTLSALTTDSYLDPQFSDSARNFTKFGREVAGYSGTDSAVQTSLLNAFAAMANPADPNYNAAVTPLALVNYVRAGFTPTNSALQNASDAEVGGWRGAMEGSGLSAGATSQYRRNQLLTVDF